MFNRILVPLDGSKLAEQALPHAQKVCGAHTELVLLQVIRLPLPVMAPDMGMSVPVIEIDDLEKEALDYLNEWVAELKKQGVAASAVTVEGDNVALAVANYARDHHFDLIVQSTHGRGGISRLVFGSVAEEVLRHAPCPVMFIRTPMHD